MFKGWKIRYTILAVMLGIVITLSIFIAFIQHTMSKYGELAAIDSRLITAIAVLIPGVLLSISVSGWISRRFTRLAETVQAIGSGNYNPKMELGGSYELNIISQELEALSAKLRGDILTLNDNITQIQELKQGVNVGPVVLFKLNLKNNFSTEYISENISMIGYTAEGIMNNQPAFASIVPEQSLLALRERLGQAIANGEDSYSIESDIICSDGSIQPQLNWYHIIKDEHGAPSLLQGMSLSIKELTDAKLRENAYLEVISTKARELQGFHKIVSSSPAFTFSCKIDEYFTTEFVTDNISVTGYSARQFTAAEIHWKQLIPDEDYALLTKTATDNMELGIDKYDIEFRINWKNGETHWYTSWNRIIRNEVGIPIKIQGLVLDITHLKQTQQKENEHRQQLEHVVNELQEFHEIVISSNSFTYRFGVTDEFPTLHVSSNISITGYHAEEFTEDGKQWSDLIPDEDYARMEARISEALEQGLEQYQVEYRMKWKNGKTHWYIGHNNILRDKHGTPTVIQGVAIDITDQKTVATRLELANHNLLEFHQIISSSPILIYRVKTDEAMTTEFISDNYSLLGYDIEKLRSGEIKWNDLIPDEDLKRVETIVEESLAEGSDTHTSEIRIRWADGTYHWYTCWNRFIFDKMKNPISIQGIMTDITDLKDAHTRDIQYQGRLKALARDLEEAEDNERRRLAYILHDDIGQMLAGLNMKLSVLKETSDRGRINELANQVDELLSKIMQTTKTLTWEISPTSLYESDMAAGLEYMADEIENYFGLHVSIQTAGMRVELDRETASFIFRCSKELLVNIAKHAEVKSAEIGISQYGDKVHLVVSDRGIGFDPQILDQSTRPGFGLFSIRERVEHVNGSLHIESSSGKGTKVMLILPLDISSLI